MKHLDIETFVERVAGAANRRKLRLMRVCPQGARGLRRFGLGNWRFFVGVGHRPALQDTKHQRESSRECHHYTHTMDLERSLFTLSQTAQTRAFMPASLVPCRFCRTSTTTSKKLSARTSRSSAAVPRSTHWQACFSAFLQNLTPTPVAAPACQSHPELKPL